MLRLLNCRFFFNKAHFFVFIIEQEEIKIYPISEGQVVCLNHSFASRWQTNCLADAASQQVKIKKMLFMFLTKTSQKIGNILPEMSKLPLRLNDLSHMNVTV